MSLQSKQGLRKKLENDSFRDAFVASRIAQTIAVQLRVLRQREGLSQDDLAKELGTSQNAISRMENPSYGKPSITTLRKIASHYKVGLIVRFAPLSEIADWTTNISSKAVDVPDLEHDTGFVDRMPVASALPADGQMQMSAMGFVSTGNVAVGQERMSNVLPFSRTARALAPSLGGFTGAATSQNVEPSR